MGFASKVRSGISSKKFPAVVKRRKGGGTTNMPKKKMMMKKTSAAYKKKYGKGGKMKMTMKYK